MDIHLAGSRPTRRAPKEYFTGTVWQDPIIAAAGAGAGCRQPGGVRARRANRLAYASARPDALCRSPASAGSRPRAARCAKSSPGDVVWIPPGEKHWHGASPTTGMVHVAMQESLDGNHVTWMEHVTDAEYAVVSPRSGCCERASAVRC